jgi:predicted transposase YbfD/YdcC
MVKVYHVKPKPKYQLIDDKMWNNWNLYVKTIIQVIKKVEFFNHKTKSWQISEEQHLYVATYSDTAARFASHIRKHWLIENSNHYVRDQTLMEDHSRIRTNPMSFAILRSFVLNILRFNKESNIREAIYRNCFSLERIFEYLGIF